MSEEIKKSRAMCTECNEVIIDKKTGEEKLYNDPQNPQIRCSNDHKGKTIAFGDIIVSKTIQGSSTTDIENKMLEEANIEKGNREQTVTFEMKEDKEGKRTYNIEGIKAIASSDDLTKVKINLKLEEKHIRSLYKAFDSMSQTIEKNAKQIKEATYYGGDFVNAMYDIYSSFWSQITRQIKFDFKKLLVWGHIALVAPVLIWSSKAFRDKRAVSKEKQKSDEITKKELDKLV